MREREGARALPQRQLVVVLAQLNIGPACQTTHTHTSFKNASPRTHMDAMCKPHAGCGGAEYSSPAYALVMALGVPTSNTAGARHAHGIYGSMYSAIWAVPEHKVGHEGARQARGVAAHVQQRVAVLRMRMNRR